jgi:hypothetical protein
MLAGDDSDIEATRYRPKVRGVRADQLKLVRVWIDAGAVIPVGETISTTRRKSDHWAFQPVVRPIP